MDSAEFANSKKKPELPDFAGLRKALDIDYINDKVVDPAYLP